MQQHPDSIGLLSYVAPLSTDITAALSQPRVAIVTTHPIQYHSVWFRALAESGEVDLDVWYCHEATAKQQAKAGFGVEFTWDIPLLGGYTHHFLKNVSPEPGADTFGGLDTPEIREIIEREKYDLVIVNGWHYKSAWQTMRACWRSKTPVMVRSDSHLHTQRSALKRAVKWPAYRWFIAKLDGYVSVGEWSADYFVHYGAEPAKIFPIPHVIDSKRFESDLARFQPLRSQLRKDWNLSSDAVVFVFAGKFIEKKRPMDFVKAIELASVKDSRITGLMVGDGPLKTECEEYVRSKSVPVSFVGFLNQTEITSAFVASDALVLPSDGGETWGLVVTEAMTCGLPCFVSNQVGCGPDMITEDTGRIFPLGSTDLLSDQMIEFAADDAERARMSAAARQMAAKYTVSEAVNGTLKAVAAVNRRK